MFVINDGGTDKAVVIDGIDPYNSATGGPTVWGHMVSPHGLSVGAVYYEDTPAFDTGRGPTNAIDPEVFSAKGGPMTVYFDRDGFPIQAGQISYEPDITTFFPGYENANPLIPSPDSDGDGDPNFFGTSAAAPNAAGVIALLLQLNSTLLPAQVETILVQTAIDVTGLRAAPGRDNVSGDGLINAQAAVYYLVDNFGIPGGAGGPTAPKSISYQFDTNAEGWRAESSPVFDAPSFSPGPDSLTATTPNNFNTLGWYVSPTFVASQTNLVFPDGTMSVRGTNGTNSLFRATYRVSSNQFTSSLVNTFRMRASTVSFEQSDVLVVTSAGNGALSPNTSAKDYEHYFSVPSTQSRFNLYFDILGFDSTDAVNSTLNVEEVIIEGFQSSSSVLTDGRFETLQLFEQGSLGWTRRDATPTFGRVNSTTSDRGIVLGGVENAGMTSFSYWGSPENNSSVVLDRNRLYKVTCSVSSYINAANRASLSPFPLRANASTNQMSSYVDLIAGSPTSNVPASGEPLDYVFYFLAPEELHGSTVNFAFDYLYVPGLGKDPNAQVTLESLRVDSYRKPAGLVE